MYINILRNLICLPIFNEQAIYTVYTVNRYYIKTFNKFGKYEFIEVKYIDHYVSFIRIRDKFYVFDKENQAIYE